MFNLSEDRASDSQDAEDERNSKKVDAFLNNASYEISANTDETDPPARPKRRSEDLAADSDDSGAPVLAKRPRLALDDARDDHLSDVDHPEPAPSSASTFPRSVSTPPPTASVSVRAEAASPSETPPVSTGSHAGADVNSSPGGKPDEVPGPTQPPQPSQETRADEAAPSLNVTAAAATSGSAVASTPSLCSQVRSTSAGVVNLLIGMMFPQVPDLL